MARVAAIQMKSDGNIKSNLNKILDLIKKCAAQGVQTVVFPENCLHLNHNSDKLPTIDLSGDEIMQVQAAANDSDIEVVLGSIPVQIEHSNLASATMVVLYPQSVGKTDSPPPVTYRKIHLFDVDLPSGRKMRESNRYVAGHEPVVAPTRVGRMGLSICYDLRFPELFIRLTSLGATCFAVAADFFYETGQDHWIPLLRARAIESQSYVIAAAQCGSHADGHRSFGHSMIIDPWGSVLAELDSENEGLITADVNLSYIRHIRSTFPTLSHKRLFTS